MVIHWKTLIRGGIANPEQRLSELPLVSSRENRFLRTWNDTVGTYPKSCIHQLFELRAQSVPGTTAIVSHGQRLSYRELNERANQLAWVLLKRD